MPPTLASLTKTYHDRGWCKVERCLDSSTIQSFVDQLKRELRAPTVPGESGHDYRAIDLEESATWFRGTERRVVEVNPPGEGDHWARIERAPQAFAVLVTVGPGASDRPTTHEVPRQQIELVHV